VGHRAGVEQEPSDRRVNELSWPTSPHAARRLVMRSVPRASAMDLAPDEAIARGRVDEPPVLASPNVVEGNRLRAIRVAPPRGARLESQFLGFLDGTQDVRVVNHCDGIPIVWATVCAGVRVRRNRRLVAWEKRAPQVSRRYYVPFRYLDNVNPEFLNDRRVVDTGEPDALGRFPTRHPAALLERALQKVQHDREDLEKVLADAWCIEETLPLYVDGSIAGCTGASQSPLAIGVVKSHRTLYGEGAAFRIVMNLDSGERSSVFTVTHRERAVVASWYVRVRPAAGRDALFGLVRIEAAMSDEVMSRADEISRWVIAEGSPLSLPDGRWDKMSYGVHETEEFLRAIS
jgi:hypothetical protein